MFELQIERHVIDAGRTIANFFHWNFEIASQFESSSLNRMAQTHLTDCRVFFRNGPGVDRHRVHILQHDCIWANFEHILTDGPKMWNSAQATHDTAYAKSIGNCLAQAIFLRHFEIGDCAGLKATDLKRNHDEIRIF